MKILGFCPWFKGIPLFPAEDTYCLLSVGYQTYSLQDGQFYIPLALTVLFALDSVSQG